MKKEKFGQITTFALLVSFASTGIASIKWPDLPEAYKNGVGVQSENTVFVGLGSVGNSFYSLDTEQENPQWNKLADFTGSVPTDPAAALINNKIYVFGGSGKQDSADLSPVIFDTVYSYDLNNDEWSQVKTKTPAGLLGASAYALNDQEIVILGGYNKDKFDTYLADINRVDSEKEPEKWQKVVDDFMGMKPEEYQWNRKVLVYNVVENTWDSKGESPYLPNCGAALVGDDNEIVLISGEIKPGLRTPKVKTVTFNDDQVVWDELAQLPAPIGHDLQEGVAAPYAGVSNETLIVAGGANFYGAREQAIRDQWFAHEGLPKAWNSEVYAYINRGWKQTETQLPEKLAYGASFTTDKGILIVGGEGEDRLPRKEVFMVNYNGNDIEIEF